MRGMSQPEAIGIVPAGVSHRRGADKDGVRCSTNHLQSLPFSYLLQAHRGDCAQP